MAVEPPNTNHIWAGLLFGALLSATIMLAGFAIVWVMFG